MKKFLITAICGMIIGIGVSGCSKNQKVEADYPARFNYKRVSSTNDDDIIYIATDKETGKEYVFIKSYYGSTGVSVEFRPLSE